MCIYIWLYIIVLFCTCHNRFGNVHCWFKLEKLRSQRKSKVDESLKERASHQRLPLLYIPGIHPFLLTAICCCVQGRKSYTLVLDSRLMADLHVLAISRISSFVPVCKIVFWLFPNWKKQTDGLFVLEQFGKRCPSSHRSLRSQDVGKTIAASWRDNVWSKGWTKTSSP